MGLFDFLLGKRQLQDQAATRIALESGLFQSCPVCHGVTEARNPEAFLEATKALVDRRVAEHDPDVELFEADADAILAAISRVGKKLPYDCTCESI